MISTPTTPPEAAADMAAARRRSSFYGIDANATEIPHHGDLRPAADALRRLSAPVLNQLLDQIEDSSIGVVLADRAGNLTRRDAASSKTLTAMDGRSIDVGFSLAESDVGTNGVGTSLETKRPALVVGDEHFLESFHGFTCANAPIFEPITRRVEGTVGVLCPVKDTGPLLLPTAVQLAEQISKLMLDQASPAERMLLEEFLRKSRRSKAAIATMAKRVLIASPEAQRLLTGVDHAELWQHVEAATLGNSSITEFDFERPSGPPLHLRCRPVYVAGEVGGATVEFIARPEPAAQPAQSPQKQQLGHLVGVSGSWRSTVRDALEATQLNEPVLVVGERGTGRLSVAEAIAAHAGPRELRVLDSATVLTDGPRQWVLDAREALGTDATLVLRRVDRLPDDVAAAVASALATSPGTARVMATTERALAAEPGLASLLGQLNILRVDIAPVRERREDIAPLVHHLGNRYGQQQVNRPVVAAFYRNSWPGNVTEIDQALRSAYAKARMMSVNVHHLPRHIRITNSRRPLHGLRQQEADAIVSAIESTTTRAEAAKLLGISRATLYRRIDAYGLGLEP